MNAPGLFTNLEAKSRTLVDVNVRESSLPFVVDVYVVEHGHEDDSITELCLVRCWISPGRTGWRAESAKLWILWNFPLEFHWFSTHTPKSSSNKSFSTRKVATWPFHCSTHISYLQVVFSQSLGDIEQTLNIIKFWILRYLQILCVFGSTCIAAFIDDTENHHHISILVFYCKLP